MIGSLGFFKETSPTYNWHGLRRGDGRFALFQYTVSGRGRLSYNGKLHDVLPGQAMLLHFPYNNHYWLPEDSSHWEFIYLCLYGQEILHLWKSYEEIAGPLWAFDENSDTVQTAFTIYERACRQQNILPFEVSEFAYQLTMHIGREGLSSQSNRKNADFEAVKLHCKFNLHKAVDVYQMAQVAGMSRYHFSRQFKKTEGISPAAFIEQQQIGRARDLLRNSTLSIKEISNACGFSDPSYFTKVFKRTENATPMRFRQKRKKS